MTLAPGGTGSPRQLGRTRKSTDRIRTGTGCPFSRVTAIVNGRVPKPKNVTQAVSVPRFRRDRKSTRLNSSHGYISYAVFCLKKKKGGDEASHRPGTTPLEEHSCERR